MMDFDAIGADKSGPDMQDSDQMSLGSGEPISPDVWDQHDGDAVLAQLTADLSPDGAEATPPPSVGGPVSTTPDMSPPEMEVAAGGGGGGGGGGAAAAAGGGGAPAPHVPAPPIDELDYVSYMVSKSHFELPHRYSNPRTLGSGAFGVVVRAFDSRTQTDVAIKKITKIYDKVGLAKRAYRELNILRLVAGSKRNKILRMLDVFNPPTSKHNSIYIVTEIAPATLKMIITSQTLQESHVRFLGYQIAVGLKYLHSAGIVHRDLKPENIAVWADCTIKIIDFGLARQATGGGARTQYVCTRWYRAPEVILMNKYDHRADLWSLGCIICELFSGQVLLRGADTIGQWKAITMLIGSPTPEFIESLEHAPTKGFVKSQAPVPAANLRLRVGRAETPLSEAAIDLIRSLFVYSIDARPDAQAALAHPFFKLYSDIDDGPVCPTPVVEPGGAGMTVDEWKDLVLGEIATAQACPVDLQDTTETPEFREEA